MLNNEWALLQRLSRKLFFTLGDWGDIKSHRDGKGYKKN